MKYVCSKECWWRLNRWHKGQIYEIEAALDPPKHFQPVDGPEPRPAPAARQEEAPQITAEGLFLCPICEKEFKGERGLNSHIRQVHPDAEQGEDPDGDGGGGLFSGDPE